MLTLDPFREKMLRGEVCFGTAITFNDPAITELLAGELDFVWIDAEHGPLTLETIQSHLMAVKGTSAFPLVRVAWNDPVLIKPVLDNGAPAMIVPLIRTAEEAALAVAACRYPPKGIRGFGPRRASRYGRDTGPAFCQAADGLSGIVIGPNDLAGSMGHIGRYDHPDVQKAIDVVITRARAANKFVGLGSSAEPSELADWARRGVQWLLVGADFVLLRKGTMQTIAAARAELAQRPSR
jgi:2-keto-3-deoxy-L-rhamnonate aldolase RhmA